MKSKHEKNSVKSLIKLKTKNKSQKRNKISKKSEKIENKSKNHKINSEKFKEIKKSKHKIVEKKSDSEVDDVEDSEEVPKKFNKKISAEKDKKMEKKSSSGKINYKADIEKLKDIDPEFYNFLKQNDKELLEFNWDDTDDDEDQPEHDEEDIHKATDKLEVASDESDLEEDGDDDQSDEKADEATEGSNAITLKLLRKWETDLQTKSSIDTIRNVIQAFSSALASITDEYSKQATYKVEGSAAFNGCIQLCVLHLQQAIYKFCNYNPQKSKAPIHKTKKWTKIRNSLRYYFIDLTRLIENVSSSKLLSVLLKHLHQMSTMIASFMTISKPILKRLIVLWSTSEESVRVLSFLCILKITRNQQHSLLNHVLKTMYLSYIRNSKFVSPNTLPGINFMRRSLVEMFALDLNIAYKHAFLYIRQLAIHLRNAIILKKKDSFQAVYNWQFINSIRLWTDLLGVTSSKTQLQPLIYPLVSITLGVIKLMPTAQFFPLRFHCIQTLVTLGKETGTFIPLLPFVIEVLNSNTFNKKHTVVSMKPMQFACILRLNKSQLAENGFRDEVVEQICSLTLEYLENVSASLAYCDLVVPIVLALKQYLKICKNANYSRKLKQVLDKTLENSKFIEEERKKINFGLNDMQMIRAWETGVHNKRTPLSIYYESWLKTHETKKKRQAAQTNDINDYDLPMIKKRKLEKKLDGDDNDVELFPSDDENDEINLKEGDDDIDEEIIKPKKEKTSKKKSKLTTSESNVVAEDDDFNENAVDIVEDLDIDDW